MIVRKDREGYGMAKGPQLIRESMVDLNEAGRQLGMASKTLRGWILRGKMDCVRVMGSVRIRQSEIDRILEESERKTLRKPPRSVPALKKDEAAGVA